MCMLRLPAIVCSRSRRIYANANVPRGSTQVLNLVLKNGRQNLRWSTPGIGVTDRRHWHKMRPVKKRLRYQRNNAVFAHVRALLPRDHLHARTPEKERETPEQNVSALASHGTRACVLRQADVVRGLLTQQICQ